MVPPTFGTIEALAPPVPGLLFCLLDPNLVDRFRSLGVGYLFASPSGEAVDGPEMDRQERAAFGLPLPVYTPSQL